MLIGVRQQVTVEVAREGDDSFKNAQVLIRALGRFDVAVARPNQLCVITNLS